MKWCVLLKFSKPSKIGHKILWLVLDGLEIQPRKNGGVFYGDYE